MRRKQNIFILSELDMELMINVPSMVMIKSIRRNANLIENDTYLVIHIQI